MKKPYLLIIIVLIFLGLNYPIILSGASIGEKNPIKPKCVLLIKNVNYGVFVDRYSAIDKDKANEENNSYKFLTITLELINNSSDTLKYIGTDCTYSRLYYVTNKNMVMQDEKCINGNTIGLLIPPHKSISTQLIFKFHKVPDTTFKFKVGMKLIKWDVKSKLKYMSYKTMDTAPVLWSETQIFRTNRKHEYYGLTEKENRKLILTEPVPIYYHLTNQDRKNYILSIDQHKITKRDTPLYYQNKEKQTLLLIPLKFTNNSKDTLKYISMSCSWLEFYQVNFKGMAVWGDGCDKNIPSIIKVAPHTSRMMRIPVFYKREAIAKNSKFKIGMSLQKRISREQPDDAYTYLLRPETSNLIWSNEVKVP